MATPADMIASEAYHQALQQLQQTIDAGGPHGNLARLKGYIEDIDDVEQDPEIDKVVSFPRPLLTSILTATNKMVCGTMSAADYKDFIKQFNQSKPTCDPAGSFEKLTRFMQKCKVRSASSPSLETDLGLQPLRGADVTEPADEQAYAHALQKINDRTQAQTTQPLLRDRLINLSGYVQTIKESGAFGTPLLTEILTRTDALLDDPRTKNEYEQYAGQIQKHSAFVLKTLGYFMLAVSSILETIAHVVKHPENTHRKAIAYSASAHRFFAQAELGKLMKDVPMSEELPTATHTAPLAPS